VTSWAQGKLSTAQKKHKLSFEIHIFRKYNLKLLSKIECRIILRRIEHKRKFCGTNYCTTFGRLCRFCFCSFMEVTRSGLVCHRIKQVSAAILLTIAKNPVFWQHFEHKNIHFYKNRSTTLTTRVLKDGKTQYISIVSSSLYGVWCR